LNTMRLPYHGRNSIKSSAVSRRRESIMVQRSIPLDPIADLAKSPGLEAVRRRFISMIRASTYSRSGHMTR